MPTDRPAAAPRLPRTRSRVTNTGGLPNVDQRGAPARRFRDIAFQIAADLGGADHLSEARAQLIRRFAACCVIAEGMESKLANGEEIDVAEHALLTSSLVRIAQRIGINRRAREVVPTLQHYLEAKETTEVESE